MGLGNIIRNLRDLGEKPDIVRGWKAEHAPEWVFEGVRGGTGLSGILNVPGVEQPAQNLVLVYACIVARREALGGVPIRVSDAEDRLIETGPVADLLRQPNPRQTWGQYVRELETNLTLYNAMAIALAGDGTVPDELIPLNPADLRPAETGIHAPTGKPVVMAWQYRDRVTAERRLFSPEEIMVHFGHNPDAPLAALSPVRVLTRTMQAELAAREQNLGVFVNDSTPRGVLEAPGAITKEHADQALEAWEDKQRGFMSRHKTAVLWGGLKYQPIGLTPAEMEYLDGLRFLRTDYYMVFRVKPAMVMEMMGETGLSQGSSSDEQKVSWWEEVGLAELRLIAEAHEAIAARFPAAGALRGERELRRTERMAMERQQARRAATGRGKVFIWFDENSIPPLVRHRLGKLEQLTKICGLGYRPDDANDWLDLGLPPHPTNIGTVPIGVQPVEDLGSAAALPPALPPRSGGLDLLARWVRIESLLRAEGAKRKAKHQAVNRAFQATVNTSVKAAARKYSRFFLEQRDRVLSRIKFAGDGLMRAAKSKAQAAVESVFPHTAEDEELVKRLFPVWAENMKTGWEFFNRHDGAVPEGKNPFAIEDPNIQDALAERKIQGLKINDTTEDDIRAIFSKGLEEGLTTAEIGDNVADYYAAQIGESSARPQTAARTQVAGIVNDGRLAAAEAVGGLKKIWIHGDPQEARPSHVRAEEYYTANPIGLEETFLVDGVEMDAPGDARAPVEQTANCTCSIGFVPSSA